MIRSTLTSRGHVLDNLSAYLGSFQENVNAVHAQVVAENAPTITDELGYTPAERDPNEKLEWTSDLQMSAFFASAGFGGGIPHERTGGLPDGWIVSNDGNGHTLIANPIPGSLYLYGSLAKTNPGAHQQAYLAAIGWQPAYETVFFWGASIAEEVFRRIDAQFGNMGNAIFNTRAYTRL